MRNIYTSNGFLKIWGAKDPLGPVMAGGIIIIIIIIIQILIFLGLIKFKAVKFDLILLFF